MYVCEYVLRDGRQGDVHDPLRRRKNKQKSGMKRRRKNRGGGRIIKTEKKCFHALSSCFPMERHWLSYTACYNRVNEPGGIWN